MLKVLIADDEHKVGYLVRKLIEWDRLNLEFAGLVQDGITAYHRICQDQPDIVITDIRMPELTGLELIKRVTEEGYKVHFIVISGYKYFEYAQQAIKYGVEDYLLKPIEENELNQILGRICELEQNREKALKRVDSMERIIHDSKHVLHREFLGSITADHPMNLDEVNQSYGLNFENGLFRVLCFKIDRNIASELNEQQLKLIMKKLAVILEDEFNPVVTDIAITQQKYGFVMAVLNYAADKKEKARQLLEQAFSKGMDYISGFENYEMTAGTSGEYSEFTMLSHGVEGAKEAADERIVSGKGRLIDIGSINRKRTLCAEEISGKFSDRLFRAAEIARYEEMKHLVNQAFHEAKNCNAFASEYYGLSVLLLKDYLLKNPFGTEEEKSYKMGLWEEMIHNCKSVLQLESFTAQTMTADWKSDLEANQEKERKPVLSAVEYIKKNFGQKLGLEEIAEQGGFNMNYFSELFKKEVGKTFTAFVMEVRMEEARRLLRDTDLPVYEVAEQVGYKDAKFFSQQFTKAVGIKPVEYRKLYY